MNGFIRDKLTPAGDVWKWLAGHLLTAMLAGVGTLIIFGFALRDDVSANSMTITANSDRISATTLAVSIMSNRMDMQNDKIDYVYWLCKTLAHDLKYQAPDSLILEK